MSFSVPRRDLLRAGFASGVAATAGMFPDTSSPTPYAATNNRKFGLGTVTYNLGRNWDLDELIRTCERNRYQAVELRSTHKHGVEPEISPAKRHEVKARFAQTDVTLFGLGSACEFHSPDADVVRKNIERTHAFLRLARDVGASGVKVRPNGLPKQIAADDTLKQIGWALQECAVIADETNVEVWVEVHGSGTSHPPHMKTIMDHCGHPKVGVTWNSNHPSDLKDGQLKPYFELLSPYIKCVHLKELHTTYPYRELFRLLRNQNYDRFTLAEISEAKDTDRIMSYFRALWNELSRAEAE